MTYEYIIIERTPVEFIPVVKANGIEIYRGRIHRDPHVAMTAAVSCDQVEAVRNGAKPSEVAL